MANTALDMIPALGARVLVRCETLQVECTVRNVKNSWGQPRLLVEPVAGSGTQWVELGRVTVPADTADGPAGAPQRPQRAALGGGR